MKSSKKNLSDNILEAFKSKNYSQLLNFANKLTNSDPKEILGWKAAGIALFKLNQKELAIKKLRKASELSESDYEIFNILGVITQEIDYEFSKKNFEKSIAINKDFIEGIYNLANLYKNNSKLLESISLYERIISLNKNFSDAYINLAEVYSELHNTDRAISYYKLALNLKPDLVEPNIKLGLIYKNRKQYDESINYFQIANKLDANNKNAFNNIGTVYEEIGDRINAKKSFLIALNIDNNYFEARHNLGKVYLSEKNLDQALLEFTNALQIQPNNINTLICLGNLYDSAKNSILALDFYKRALLLDNRNYKLANTIGSIYFTNKEIDAAEIYFLRSIEISQDFHLAIYNLGLIKTSKNLYDEAIKLYEKAININADFDDAKINLSNVLLQVGDVSKAENIANSLLSKDLRSAEFNGLMGRVMLARNAYSESMEFFSKALETKGDNATILNNYGLCFASTGKHEEAILYYLKALEVKPDMKEAYINISCSYLSTTQYDNSLNALEKLLDKYPDYNLAHKNRLFLLAQKFDVDKSYYESCINKYSELTKRIRNILVNYSSRPNKLRIGFVSADLNNHPVGFFLEDMLCKLNDSSLEFYAYSLKIIEDNLSHRIKPFFQKWVTLKPSSSSKERADYIQEDSLHILFDLSGHTLGNDLEIFSYKPAPIQVTWLGYFATTGIEAIDYILGDPLVTPLLKQDDFVEKIWQMPNSYFSFSKPEFNVKVNDLPAQKNGFITFGSFNNISKINSRVINIWIEILLEVENSKLFLKSPQLNDPSTKVKIRDMFTKNGVENHRLILEGGDTRENMLKSYQQIDIALDPFPYPGGTTSCESIWMGVPVITLKGNSFLSNVGVSIAHNSGNGEFIAEDEADYIRKAKFFTSDIHLLSTVRSSMREKISKLPLFNTTQFAVDFERQMWHMWEQHCRANNIQ